MYFEVGSTALAKFVCVHAIITIRNKMKITDIFFNDKVNIIYIKEVSYEY